MEHSEDDLNSKTQYFSTSEYSGGDMYAYNTPAPPEPIVERKRPIIISIFCVIGFIGVASAPIIAMTDDAKRVGDWYPVYLLFGAVAYLFAYVGLWMMKSWSPIVLVLMFLVNQAVLYGMGLWTPISLGNVLVVAVALSYMKKMD